MGDVEKLDKFDYKKKLKELYFPPSRNPVVVEVPAMNFLMIDGEGDPNTSQAFKDAVEALYGTAYTIKFMLKKQGRGPEYTVPPLEGLWYADDPRVFMEGTRDEWRWTLGLMQPDWVSEADAMEGMRRLREKKGGDSAPGDAASVGPALDRMRFESFNEGKAAQVMHVGPFSEEGPTVEKLMAFIERLPQNRLGQAEDGAASPRNLSLHMGPVLNLHILHLHVVPVALTPRIC